MVLVLVESRAARVPLRGGVLCLDFANTMSDHGSEHPNDHLHDYADLLAWSWHAGLLTEPDAAGLLAEAGRHPERAAAVFRQALDLRETMYRIFSPIAAGRAPTPTALEELNAALKAALPHARLARTSSGFAWTWPEEQAMDRMLWPIAGSAADLLTSDRLDRVRECPGERCGWLFLDTTRNRSRRWCDMADCGNRAKARRHYRRSRGQAGTAA